MKVLKIVIAGVLVAAALLWVFGIPANFLINLVQDRVETATGYRLHVDGGTTIGFWPAPTISLRNVTLDHAGAPTQGQFKAENVRVALALADLLRGHTRITELTLSRPTLRVPLARKRIAAATVSGSPAAAPASGPGGGVGTKAAPAAAGSDETTGAIAIDRILIEDGTVGLYSKPDRLEKNIEHINLDLSRAAVGGRPSATGHLDWGGQTFQVEVKSDVLPQHLEGQTIPVEVTLQAPGRWQHPLSMKAELRSRKNSFVINSLSGQFGQNRFDGFATVDFSTNKPVVKADLDFNRLQVPQAPGGERAPPQNPAPEPQSGHDSAPPNVANPPRSDGAPPNAAAGPESGHDNPPRSVANPPRSDGENARPQNVLGRPWSDRELHFDGLNFFDAEVRVSATELTLGSFRVAPVTVEATVNKGLLQARLEHVGLYGGEANGVISLDAAASTPAHAMQIHLAGVNALPLLSDVAGFESLEGTLRADIDVNAKGRSQQAMISSLAGSVDVELSNGAVRGIDVAKLVHNLTRTIVEGWQQNAADRTPLTRFNAHFSLANGVASTDNLDLSGPVVRMTGAGSVDLAAKTLQLKVDPQLVTGRQAAGGSADTAGLGVPVIIAGSWSEPRIYPDVAGILNNPESVYNQLKAAGKGLFGDSGSGNEGKLGTILKGLGNMLNAPAGNRNGGRGDEQ